MKILKDLDHKLTEEIYKLSGNSKLRDVVINATILLGSIPAFFILLFQLGIIKALILTIISYTFNYLVNEYILKEIFKRKRPEFTKKKSYSFPSTHSSNLMCLLIISLFLLNGGIVSIILLIYFFLLSFSRIFVGEHYLFDIFGGWVIGIPYSIIVFQIFTIVLGILSLT